MKYVELRKLAEDASPGPWHIGPFVAVDTGIWSHGTWPIATTQVDSAAEGLTSTVERKTLDAAYVAAASPDVILALLDEREQLRAEIAAQHGVDEPAKDLLTEAEMRQVFSALHERERQLIAYINHEMLVDDGYSCDDLANTSSARRKLYAYDWTESKKREAALLDPQSTPAHPEGVES